MNIQPVSATYFAHAMERASSFRHISPAVPADSADPVHISSAARAALTAEGDASVEAKLASIRARGPINRSEADQAYLFTHDQRLAEIAAQGKPPEKLTADELDYMQKATGLVNTTSSASRASMAAASRASTAARNGCTLTCSRCRCTAARWARCASRRPRVHRNRPRWSCGSGGIRRRSTLWVSFRIGQTLVESAV